MNRNEQRAAKVVRLLDSALAQLRKVEVFERAVNEARELRDAMEVALHAAENFETENAPYSSEELEEDE